MNAITLFPIYSRLAGSCDFITGLILVWQPSLAMRFMGIQHPPADLIFLSFIGAFVAAVGAVYLILGSRPKTEADLSAARAMWLITAIVRVSVGGFVAAACFTGILELAWASVAMVDLSLAGFQFLLLGRGWALAEAA